MDVIPEQPPQAQGIAAPLVRIPETPSQLTTTTTTTTTTTSSAGWQCTAPIRFLSTTTTTTNERDNVTLLASFPGSGNTWMRALIEEGMRARTGSIIQEAE